MASSDAESNQAAGRAAKFWLGSGLLFLALGLSMLAAQAQTTPSSVCDPSPLNQWADEARTCRLNHDFSCVQDRIAKFRARDDLDGKNNFRAGETAALAQLDQSGLATAPATHIDQDKYKNGMSELRHVAKQLSPLAPKCQATALAENWYGIYNIIGAEYFNYGTATHNAKALLGAEQYLFLAYQNLDKVPVETRKYTLDNLSLLFRSLGDWGEAARYLREAVTAGYSGGQAKARLEQAEQNARVLSRVVQVVYLNKAAGPTMAEFSNYLSSIGFDARVNPQIPSPYQFTLSQPNRVRYFRPEDIIIATHLARLANTYLDGVCPNHSPIEARKHTPDVTSTPSQLEVWIAFSCPPPRR